MRPLRTAALVMVAIAAVDGLIDGVEYLATANLWPVMLLTGLAVLIVDMLFDKRTAIGRLWNRLLEWIAAGCKSFIDWNRSVLFGSGEVKEEAKSGDKAEETASESAATADATAEEDSTAAKPAPTETSGDESTSREGEAPAEPR